MGALLDPGGLYALLNPIVLSYALIISRLSGLFLSSPFFSTPQVPTQLKTFTLMIIAMLLLGPVGVKTDLAGLQPLHYAGLIAVEVVIGLFIGLIITSQESTIDAYVYSSLDLKLLG